MSSPKNVPLFLKLSCISLIIGCLVSFTSADDAISETFDVKPGGHVQEYSKKAYGITFKFIYAAQGGTKEEWTAQIEKDTGKGIRFSVSRPSGMSYLFFQQFRLEADGLTVIQADATSESTTSLRPEEYTVGKNFIENVEGKFESHLASAYLIGQKGKPEL